MTQNDRQSVTFYDFIQKPLDYPDLFRTFLQALQSIKNSFQSYLITKYKEILLLIEVEKFHNQDVLKEDANKDLVINAFFIYKAIIKESLGIDIDQHTSFEEVLAYLYILEGRKKESRPADPPAGKGI